MKHPNMVGEAMGHLCIYDYIAVSTMTYSPRQLGPTEPGEARAGSRRGHNPTQLWYPPCELSKTQRNVTVSSCPRRDRSQTLKRTTYKDFTALHDMQPSLQLIVPSKGHICQV